MDRLVRQIAPCQQTVTAHGKVGLAPLHDAVERFLIFEFGRQKRAVTLPFGWLASRCSVSTTRPSGCRYAVFHRSQTGAAVCERSPVVR